MVISHYQSFLRILNQDQPHEHRNKEATPGLASHHVSVRRPECQTQPETCAHDFEVLLDVFTFLGSPSPCLDKVMDPKEGGQSAQDLQVALMKKVQVVHVKLIKASAKKNRNM